MGSPRGSDRVKNMPAVQETWVRSLDRKDPLEKEMATPVSLPGEFHGQRSLVVPTPWRQSGQTHSILYPVEIIQCMMTYSFPAGWPWASNLASVGSSLVWQVQQHLRHQAAVRSKRVNIKLLEQHLPWWKLVRLLWLLVLKQHYLCCVKSSVVSDSLLPYGP